MTKKQKKSSRKRMDNRQKKHSVSSGMNMSQGMGYGVTHTRASKEKRASGRGD
jgi:hypothetical protein